MYWREDQRWLLDMTLSFFPPLHCLIFCLSLGKTRCPCSHLRGGAPQETLSLCVFWRLVATAGLGAKEHRGHLERRQAAVWDNLCVGVGREGRLTNRTWEQSRWRAAQRGADVPWVSQGTHRCHCQGSSVGCGGGLAGGLPGAESPHTHHLLCFGISISPHPMGYVLNRLRHQSWH